MFNMSCLFSFFQCHKYKQKRERDRERAVNVLVDLFFLVAVVFASSFAHFRTQQPYRIVDGGIM